MYTKLLKNAESSCLYQTSTIFTAKMRAVRFALLLTKKKMGIILVHTYILEDIQKRFPTLYPLARREFVRNNITCVQLAVASGYSDKQDIGLMKRNIRKNLMFYITSDASKGYKIYAILISVNHRLLKLLP